jgi:hypothetical protein
MTTAAISSLPCCAATPECPTALEAAAAARFGDGIFAFGAFVMKAVGRHLARGAHDGAAVQQPVGVQPSPETSAEAILEAEVETLEADAAAFWLRDPAGIDRAQESSCISEPTSDPIPFDDAVATKVKVICKWYKRHRGYAFTYDGPVDTEQYSMEFALGMLPLTLPDEHGRLALRDPAQGPMLDEALKLTQPSKKKGSKRSRGEEVLAERAKRARETVPPEGQRPAPTEVPRAPGKRRATAAPGMQ